MTEAQQERPANHLPLPRWTLAIHGVQVLFGVIVLGLAAFGVHVWPYNVLIFSIVCAILTFGACAYIVGTTLSLKHLYNAFIVLGLHLLLDLFWLVAMGLVASLARIWGNYSTSRSYEYYWYFYKRDLSKRDASDITVKQYWSVLTVIALFCAAELMLWAASTILVFMALIKHRKNSKTSTQVPPQATNTQVAPTDEKYVHTGAPQQPPATYQQPGAAYQQPSQQQYTGGVYQQPQSGVSTPQSQYPQPYGQPVPQAQASYGQQPMYNQPQQHIAPYPQDPVNRTGTVSPVSQSTYDAPPQNTSELASPQPGGNYNYSGNVSELSTPQHNGAVHPTASELPSRQ